MAPKFGTSGLRGLVSELTPDCVAAHVLAFLAACPAGTGLCLGWDLRPSSPAIAGVVAAAARSWGVAVSLCGAVPTPALAAWAGARGAAAIMVTGSHIPADRNGLKFYTPSGEITAEQQRAIEAALGPLSAPAETVECADCSGACAADYHARYVRAFGPAALSGLRIGIWDHSTVARDLLAQVVRALGGLPLPFGRSADFVPLDTEALDPAAREALARRVRDGGLDAVISADGDADRPLVVDDRGRVVPGDILGPLTARTVGARVLCTPVTSNGAVDAMGFDRVRRSAIGSPKVIAAMLAEGAGCDGARVAGYEANGGFLLGFDAAGPAGPLPALMTRDAVLPAIAPLAAARARGIALSALVDDLPARFTASDRLADYPTDRAALLVAALRDDRARLGAFLSGIGTEAGRDLTDGLRLRLTGGEVVHLRPSGNAPELRCYAEAANPARAAALVRACLDRAAVAPDPGPPNPAPHGNGGMDAAADIGDTGRGGDGN